MALFLRDLLLQNSKPPPYCQLGTPYTRARRAERPCPRDTFCRCDASKIRCGQFLRPVGVCTGSELAHWFSASQEIPWDAVCDGCVVAVQEDMLALLRIHFNTVPEVTKGSR